MQRFVDDTILENQFWKKEYFWKMLVLLITMDVQWYTKSMQIECKIWENVFRKTHFWRFSRAPIILKIAKTSRGAMSRINFFSLRKMLGGREHRQKW